jgi:hypothetical protein
MSDSNSTAQTILIINSFKIPHDIALIIIQFLFYHTTQIHAIRHKKALIYSFQKGLHYHLFYGRWAISFRYERMLTSVNCLHCGNFINSISKNKNIICSCNSSLNDENNDDVQLQMYI